MELLKKREADITRIEQGLEPETKLEPMLLSEFIKVYLEERRRLGKAHRTITTDEYALKRLLDYAGDCALTTITDETVRRYRDHKLQQIKPASVAIEFRTLKAAFSWAVEKPGIKYLRKNPFKQKGLIPSSKDRKIPLCFSPEEKRRFLDAIDVPEHKLLFQFLLLTGCRRSEATQLEWDDIDLAQKQIVFRKTKSGKDRVAPISVELWQVIMALDRSKPRPFPYHPDWLTHLFKRHLRAAGIEKDFHLHRLRNTAASDLVRKRIPLTQIKEFLGHSSVKVTEIYTHALPEDLREVAEALTCAG
jgi:integrase